MALELVTIQDHEKWGKLVKTWTTKKNYFNTLYKGAIPQTPTSLQDLQDQCDWAGVGLYLPPRIKAIQVVSANLEVFMIHLPAAELVKEGEDAVVPNPANYPVPDFYSRLAFDSAPPHVMSAEAFHNCRIGDYVMGQCW